jgi:hypothetical protein
MVNNNGGGNSPNIYVMGLTEYERTLVKAERDRLAEEARVLWHSGTSEQFIRAHNMRYKVAKVLLENISIEDFVFSLELKEDRDHYMTLFRLYENLYL